MAWGLNDRGQTTVPVAAQSGVRAIAAGREHTVALKGDGSVVTWGSPGNDVPISAQSGVSAIAAGSFHTVALKDDGSVVTWGSTGTDVPIPAQSGVSAIAAGYSHTVALRTDGSVVAWGNNDHGQIDVPIWAQSGVREVTAIAAGAWHNIVLVIPSTPSITTQPVDQAVNRWQSASLTVLATGYALNYQWCKDGVALAGATNAAYSLRYAQINQTGNYTVVVSNPLGSLTSAPPAVLTVTPAAAGAVVAWGGTPRCGEATTPAKRRCPSRRRAGWWQLRQAVYAAWGLVGFTP